MATNIPGVRIFGGTVAWNGPCLEAVRSSRKSNSSATKQNKGHSSWIPIAISFALVPRLHSGCASTETIPVRLAKFP